MGVGLDRRPPVWAVRAEMGEPRRAGGGGVGRGGAEAGRDALRELSQLETGQMADAQKVPRPFLECHDDERLTEEGEG